MATGTSLTGTQRASLGESVADLAGHLDSIVYTGTTIVMGGINSLPGNRIHQSWIVFGD